MKRIEEFLFAKRWLCTGLLLLLAILVAILLLLARFVALRSIDLEVQRGLSCIWSVEFRGESVNIPLLIRLITRARPTNISIDYELQNGRQLAAAINTLGCPTEISIAQGNSVEVQKLLRAIEQPAALGKLFLFNVSLPDSFSDELSRFYNLRGLAIVPSDMTGEKFPLLAHLVNLDLSYSPINDAGFARLMELPNLRGLKLKEPRVSAGGLDRVGKFRPSLEHLRISASGLDPLSLEGLTNRLQQSNPETKIEITK
jgi:hypothetical protein